MALYLNADTAYKDFQILRKDPYFVDKSSIIAKINARIKTKNRFLCITKPRRFGKTSVLNMLGAYYGRSFPSKELFDSLLISKNSDYTVHLNQYHIIRFSLNELPGQKNTYQDYICRFKQILRTDLKEAYPQLAEQAYQSLADLLTATGDEFISIIDEWDYIFSHGLYTDNQLDFLEFLRDLLKDRPYAALVYMTGVLPIKKYSTGSALNITLAYLSARNKYRVEREEKSGKGFADFIFYPKRKGLPGIILELKADSTPQAAIRQIQEWEYQEKLVKEGVTKILFVGINYDSAKKEHQCRIQKADV